MSSALDVLDELDGESGEEVEAMTASEVLQKLEEVRLFIRLMFIVLDVRLTLVIRIAKYSRSWAQRGFGNIAVTTRVREYRGNGIFH